MQKSTTRIRTSHVGRLPPPKGWEDMPARLANAEVLDSGEIASHVVPAIAETVKKQVERLVSIASTTVSSGPPAASLIMLRTLPASRRVP